MLFDLSSVLPVRSGFIPTCTRPAPPFGGRLVRFSRFFVFVGKIGLIHSLKRVPNPFIIFKSFIKHFKEAGNLNNIIRLEDFLLSK